jgi:hypothetical protein
LTPAQGVLFWLGLEGSRTVRSPSER